MNKGIGFDRTIRLDWLDAAASLCVQNVEPRELRRRLDESISGRIQGPEARAKTITVLSAIWVGTEQLAPQIRREALELFPTLSSPGERLWLHYGLALVRYPVFRKVTAVIGRTSRTQDCVTRRMLKERLAAEYGSLGALKRAVERIAASLTDWGALVRTERTGVYHIQARGFRASQELQSWLLSCALFAHPSDGLPYQDLTHLPELFPFEISVRPSGLRADGRFELVRQGGGLEIVSLKGGE